MQLTTTKIKALNVALLKAINTVQSIDDNAVPYIQANHLSDVVVRLVARKACGWACAFASQYEAVFSLKDEENQTVKSQYGSVNLPPSVAVEMGALLRAGFAAAMEVIAEGEMEADERTFFMLQDGYHTMRCLNFETPEQRKQFFKLTD